MEVGGGSGLWTMCSRGNNDSRDTSLLPLVNLWMTSGGASSDLLISPSFIAVSAETEGLQNLSHIVVLVLFPSLWVFLLSLSNAGPTLVACRVQYPGFIH